MKRFIILLLSIQTSILTIAQNTFIGSLTPDMKKDMATINSHIRTKSAPSVLAKDLESLLLNMVPYKELKDVELQKRFKLQRFPEYYDLEAACRLSLAYMRQKASKNGGNKDNLHDIEFRIQNKDNKNQSTFQDFICALAKYEYLVPKYADGITLEGINAQTTAVKSDNVKEILYVRSELRRLGQIKLQASKCAMANDLLMIVIKGYNQSKIKDLATAVTLNESVMAKIIKYMGGILDSYIHQWITIKYPAEYIINPIKTSDRDEWSIYNKERDEKKLYASIRELSKQGYGPATYKVGVDYETERLKKELPKEAARCYELAYRQGSAAGAIRYAHCLTTGYGCDVNRQQAYEILRSFTQDVEFAKNGAYAYAVLLEDGYGGEADILDIMQYYTMAAEQGLRYTEKEAAQKRVNQLYEKYYK